MSAPVSGSRSPAGPAARPAGAGVLVVTCVSTLVVNANTSAVTILLPAIGRDVGASTTTLQWAVTGYLLVGAAVIITGGVLGDIIGRRRIFVAALALFVVSCGLIGLSGGAAGVIVGRAVQGAAGATLLACGLSLLSVAATGAAQVRAVALWGAASAVGAAAGPLVGGALVDSTGWQGLFWIDAGIAACCIPLTVRTVAESRDVNRPRVVDMAGTLLVAAMLMAVMLGLSKGSSWGWNSAATLGSFAAAVVAGVGFVAVERRVRAPLIDLRLLRNGVLVGATLSILLVAGAINGLMYVISLYFQDPAGFAMDPLQAGLATLPAAAGIVVITPFVSGLATRIGLRTVIAVGFVITTAGFAMLLFLTSSWRYGLFVLPLIAIAVGMALSNGCASSAATIAVSQREVGAASGISNMARYVGAALFTAAAATIYGTAATEQGAGRSQALVDGVTRCALLMAIASASGVALAVLYGRGAPGRSSMPRRRPRWCTAFRSAVGIGSRCGEGKTAMTESPGVGDRPVSNRVLWTGGVVVAVIAGLVAVVGILIARGLVGVAILAPKGDGVWGNANTATYALSVAGAALVATGLLRVLLLVTPRATRFFGWIMVLATLIAVVIPLSLPVDREDRVATAVLNLTVGLVITGLVASLARAAVRQDGDQLTNSRSAPRPTPNRRRRAAGTGR